MSRADTVFVGGRLLIDGMPRRGGIAVRDGRIALVGTDDDVRAMAGAATEVVDVTGGLVTPGFQDAHAHPLAAGVDLLHCDLNDCASAQQTMARIATYAATHPDVAWIVGSGWSMAHFAGGTPTHEMLDAVVADRPAILSNSDGHGAWANSRALELAGVDASTPDPPDGRIERDASGAPQGTLHEGAAGLVERLAPAPTPDEQLAGLLKAQEVMFSHGITAWQDAAVGEGLGQPDSLPVYLAAHQSGALTARVVAALWWDRARGAEQLSDLVERRAAARDVGFRATSVKIMQDGVVENFSAGLLDSYLDSHGRPTGNRGLSFVDPIALRAHVTALDAAGFQVHFHAIGDRAVHEALDAVEAAQASNGRTAARHHVAHVQVVARVDVPRFKELRTSATIQPLWAAHEPQMDNLTITFLGADRAALQYPFGDLVAAGAHLAAGSDWPVSSPNPLLGAHVAVNRVLPGARGAEAEPLYPHNRIDLATALRAYTAGSAYVNHLDDKTGRLEVGLLADLVVLDRDPFAGPPEKIASTRVVATYVEGKSVFRAGSG